MADDALGHLWQALGVIVLRLKAGDLHCLAALPRAANLLAVYWAELFLAVFARLNRDPARLAFDDVSPVSLKSALAL